MAIKKKHKKYKYTEKTGRPTDYQGKKTIKKVQEYLKGCEDTERSLIKSSSEKGYEMYENKIVVNLPTIEGVAIFLKISRETVYEWEKIHKDFSDIIGELRAKQAQALINKGLSGDYNSTIAKVLLTKHGYRDSQELTGKDGKDLPAPISAINYIVPKNPKKDGDNIDTDIQTTSGVADS